MCIAPFGSHRDEWLVANYGAPLQVGDGGSKPQQWQIVYERMIDMETENDLKASTELTSKVQVFRDAARNCAMSMLENASYIQKELVNVRMTDEMRIKVSEVCDAMTGTKHDVIHELFELDDLLAEGATTSRILQKINMTMRCIVDDIGVLRPTAMALEEESEQDNTYDPANLLVGESTNNILNAFLDAHNAAQACTK